MSIHLSDWLSLVEREYLGSFIGDGGAAVKFLVARDSQDISAVRSKLDQIAEGYGLMRANIDAAITRIHMIQDIFFGVARQVDWKPSAQRFMEDLFRHEGMVWPRKGEACDMREIADANGIDLTIMRRDVKRWLTRSIMRDSEMAQDFRIAMTQLCHDRLDPNQEEHAIVAPVLEWLRGELRLVSVLRQAMIFSKVTRYNARPMLRSLGHWLRLVGYRGLLLTIDIRQLTRNIPTGTDQVRYTPSSIMDAYEVLRQVIDDVDHFEGFFLVVLADESFISDRDPKRSVDCYTALKMRIWDDVRARDRDNPLAPMVVIEPQVGTPT